MHDAISTLSARTGRWFGLVLGLFYFVLASLKGEEKALVASVMLGVLGIIGYIAWDFRRKYSFWLVMLGVVVVHLLLMVLAPSQDTHLQGFILVAVFIATSVSVSLSLTSS